MVKKSFLRKQESILKNMFKFAPDGCPFIIVSALITAVVCIFGGLWVAILPLSVTIFMAFFFRDPERKTPEGKGIFVSPADGKVILIGDTYEKDYLKAESKEVSIFMSLFDVHVNRAPYDGVVKSVVHTHGRFLSAFRPQASLQNENIAMLLGTKDGEVLVRQVAGFLARKAVCRVSEGDFLKAGDRYGIIRFGSRLDVYLPKDSEIKVKLGERVKAGETVIATLNR